MSEKSEELVDEVIEDAKNLQQSTEWGSGVVFAERNLDKSEKALRSYIEKLELAINIIWEHSQITPADVNADQRVWYEIGCCYEEAKSILRKDS